MAAGQWMFTGVAARKAEVDRDQRHCRIPDQPDFDSPRGDAGYEGTSLDATKLRVSASPKPATSLAQLEDAVDSVIANRPARTTSAAGTGGPQLFPTTPMAGRRAVLWKRKPPRAPMPRARPSGIEEALARIADPKGEGARACLTVYADVRHVGGVSSWGMASFATG
jgi:hypothetical protein